MKGGIALHAIWNTKQGGGYIASSGLPNPQRYALYGKSRFSVYDTYTLMSNEST